MKPKDASAKIDEDGTIRITEIKPKGCIDILSELATKAVVYGVVFVIGVIVGFVLSATT